MAVRKRGKTYQADFMFNRKRYRETFDTYKAAEEWEALAKTNLRLGKNLPPVNNGRTETGAKLETLKDMLEHVEKTHWRFKRSAETLTRNARQVVEILGPTRRVDEITSADLSEAYAEFIERGAQPATANRKMAAISKLLTVAQNAGVIVRKPVIPKQPESEGRTRYLTEDEQDMLINLLDRWGQEDVKDFVIIALDTGCRLTEILSLSWSDFTPGYEMVHIWITKNQLSRSLPLTDRAKKTLAAIYERQAGETDGPFMHLSRFGKLRTILTRAFETLGWDDVTIHTFRHTCATRLAMKLPIQKVQKWLGHKNIKTTMRYSHLSVNALADCRQVLEGAL